MEPNSCQTALDVSSAVTDILQRRFFSVTRSQQTSSVNGALENFPLVSARQLFPMPCDTRNLHCAYSACLLSAEL